jgi:hypothetical protein
MKSPQRWNLVMHPVVPVLGKIVGNAENKNTPEERNPPKDIVLAWKQTGKYREAEPGKEWSKDQLWNSEAREIKCLFIPGPLVTIESKGKLNHTKNDDEEHERVAMCMVRSGMMDARDGLHVLPGLAAAQVQR